MKRKIYDVIIVGAGPIGLACGIEAVKRKFEYLIIEKGCLVNSIYNFPVNMTFFSQRRNDLKLVAYHLCRTVLNQPDGKLSSTIDG